jgi:hypothetical protein
VAVDDGGDEVGTTVPTDDDRQRYGRLLDSARERGLIDDDEYSHRLTELGEADSIEELTRIVSELPVLGSSAPGDAVAKTGGSSPQLRGLDPVDMAMLASRNRAPKAESSRRWLALVVIAIIFLVLMILGFVLAAHARSVNDNGLGGQLVAHLRSVAVVRV